MNKSISVFIVILFFPLYLFAEETLYPSGYNLISLSESNSYNIYSGDTLVLTRTIVNNETFSLTGLYFSDYIPQVFNLIEHSITRNGNTINYESDNPTESVYSGTNSLHLIVDNPSGSVQNSVYPGDSIILILKFTCSTTGSYSFPMHTSSFYGNESGFFSTDEAMLIQVTEPLDTIPPARIEDLEAL